MGNKTANNSERILAYTMSKELTETDLKNISGARSVMPNTFGPVTTQTGHPGGQSDTETSFCADWT